MSTACAATRAARAHGRVLHPGRVERRALARSLYWINWRSNPGRRIPTATWPTPG